MNVCNKPKTMWSIVKTITNNKNNIDAVSIMVLDGKITTHNQTIADKLNNYYISVADSIININFTNNTNGDTNKIGPWKYVYSVFKQSFMNIKMKNTTTNEIENVIKELKIKQSWRHDEITTEILKMSSPYTVSQLIYICNRYFQLKYFQTD